MIQKLKSLGYRLYMRDLRKRYGVSGGDWLLAESFLGDWRRKTLPATQIRKIHRRGFTVEDWNVCGLTEENYKRYLSSAEYCAMHPINGMFSKWIDDKLTLKYLTYGTKADSMPHYFFSIRRDGQVNVLPDAPEGSNGTVEAIAALLREEKCLAEKQMAGSLGEGFYKAEYIDGTYRLNGVQIDENELLKTLSGLREYLVMEYLRPHPYFAQFCPDTVNCIRCTVARLDGKLEYVVTFIRIGTKQSAPVENYGAGGVLCMLDENGCFQSGNIFDFEHRRNIAIHTHPDSGVMLEGRVPHWAEIRQAVETFAENFPQLDYMGFDFVVTDKDEVKLLEINSLPSLDMLQFNGSVLEGSAAAFYKRRISRK